MIKRTESRVKTDTYLKIPSRTYGFFYGYSISEIFSQKMGKKSLKSAGVTTAMGLQIPAHHETVALLAKN